MQKFRDAVFVATDRPAGAMRPAGGASVTVKNLDGTTPTLYSDNGVTPLASNVVTTDSSGEYSFYAPNGRYRLTIASQVGSESVSDIVLFDPADANAVDSSKITFVPAGTGAVNRTVQARLREFVSTKDYGAVGDNTTSDQTAVANAYAEAATESSFVYSPPGTYRITSKPSGFALRRRVGPGVINLNGAGNIYPDDDILRYDPNDESTTDYSVRLTRNRADINTDPTKTGWYFYQNYTSSNPSRSSLFGFAANVKRSGGTAKVVPMQANGFAIDGGSQSVWGIATEAWTGDSTTEGTGSCSLIGGEFAVHSQYHANTGTVIGADHVFYLKPGSGGDVLHGSAGSNQFNKNSRAIQISTGFNEGRPASGAYNGWNTGIYFASNSLDESVDGKAIGIHMGDLIASRMRAAIKIPKTVPIIMGEPTGGGGIEDGFVYKDDTSRRRIEIVRAIGSGSEATALILDMSSTGPTGTVMAFDTTGTTVGAAGAASAPPATPALYARIRISGTNYKIPLYN